MDRRTFIGTTAAVAVGTMSRFSWAAAEHRVQKIGLELYTVRTALDKDFAGTIKELAKIAFELEYRSRQQRIDATAYFRKISFQLDLASRHPKVIDQNVPDIAPNRFVTGPAR